MMRSLAAALLLASGWSWTGDALDRLLWNQRERSAAGIQHLENGRDQEALEAFETAVRLDPENPVLLFNAGSAHLTTGSADSLENALPHLEAAAGLAAGDLATGANYNLGNARLAAGDTGGAIEAYEQALRLAPENEDAKFNLELALRRQQEEQQQQQQQNQGGDSSDQNDSNSDQERQEGDDEQQDGENESDPQEQEKQPEQPEQPEEQQSGSQEGENESDEGGKRDRPMPQFEDQPDMTAEQAAAILEAVENLEREQRRLQAAEEMKKRPKKGKDW